MKNQLPWLKSPALPLTLGRAMTDYTTTNPINIFCRFLMHFGAATPVTDIGIPQVKEYVQARQAEGAAASTINEEKAALSRLLQDLVDARMLEANPVLMVPNLSEKAGHRADSRVISRA